MSHGVKSRGRTLGRELFAIASPEFKQTQIHHQARVIQKAAAAAAAAAAASFALAAIVNAARPGTLLPPTLSNDFSDLLPSFNTSNVVPAGTLATRMLSQNQNRFMTCDV
jgi:hypothetical protein